jgi:hypothetical protein
MLLTSVQRTTLVLLALGLLGVAAVLGARRVLAVGSAAPAAESTAAAATTPDEPAGSKDERERPRVVRVFPADGATDVDPVTEIRIRFDRPMDPGSACLIWTARTPVGFRPRGEMRYAEDSHEFILPVRLTPGSKHEVSVNRESSSSGKEKEYEGFRARKGRTAASFRWSFTTASPAAGTGKGPRPTAVEPPSDSEVSLVTPLEVTFDQPMDPGAYGLFVAEPAALDRRPELMGPATYDPDRHRFTLLTRLPPNWNGELRLEGFRTRDGVAAEPVTVKYRTLRSALSESQQKRVEAAGRSRELHTLIERVRKARRDLRSVSERAVMASIYGSQSPDWYDLYQSWGSRFAVQGGDKFVGVVDDVMGMPFRVGCDGDRCWFRSRDERVVLPIKDVAQRNVLVGDPFDAAGRADAAGVIADGKLEYLGETTVRGRRCHRVRSWAVHFVTPDWLSPVRDWYIDAATLLPLRVEAAGTGLQAIDFTHGRVNEAIPDEEFRPGDDAGVRAVDAEPLKKGYSQRFLNVIDGSTGRMSVRWGMQGPRGTASSGLN